jgi:hypothetical protein
MQSHKATWLTVYSSCASSDCNQRAASKTNRRRHFRKKVFRNTSLALSIPGPSPPTAHKLTSTTASSAFAAPVILPPWDSHTMPKYSFRRKAPMSLISPKSSTLVPCSSKGAVALPCPCPFPVSLFSSLPSKIYGRRSFKMQRRHRHNCRWSIVRRCGLPSLLLTFVAYLPLDYNPVRQIHCHFLVTMDIDEGTFVFSDFVVLRLC